MAWLMGIHCLFLLLTSLSISLLPDSTDAAPVGICYGRVANNLPPPSEVVSVLKSNGISNVRLFNADPTTLGAFSGTGISLTIGVPNEVLPTLAGGTVATSIQWLQSNILAHVTADQVRYIAVGNEIFLQDPFYAPFLVPSIANLYQALQALGLAGTVKLSSPHATAVLSISYPPSAGAFDPNLRPVMVPLLQFLQETGSPFMVNVYPFFSYKDNPKDVSIDYALSGSTNVGNSQNLGYDSLFDASIDACVYAMEKEGFPGIPVLVTETGWPKAGGEGASPENASAYNGNILRKALNNFGTPRRPGVGVEVFLFDVHDENEKGGEECEKHFGIFELNGAKAYDINFN